MDSIAAIDEYSSGADNCVQRIIIIIDILENVIEAIELNSFTSLVVGAIELF